MLNNLGALQSSLLQLPNSNNKSSNRSTTATQLRDGSDATAQLGESGDDAVAIWVSKLSAEVDTWVQALARSECNKVSKRS